MIIINKNRIIQLGKHLQGREAMLNINTDHRTKDLVTDAAAVALLVQKEMVAEMVTQTKKPHNSKKKNQTDRYRSDNGRYGL